MRIKAIIAGLALAVVGGVIAGAFLALSSPTAQAEENSNNIVVALRGTDRGVEQDLGGVPHVCFSVDLVDLKTDDVVGQGTDCLNLGSIAPIGDDGGFGIDNTTFFNFPEGRIVSLSRTTVQPVETAVPGATHITGEVNMGDNILSFLGEGDYEGMTGSTRLSGTVDMSEFAGPGTPITFDCIFVIHLNNGADGGDGDGDGDGVDG